MAKKVRRSFQRKALTEFAWKAENRVEWCLLECADETTGAQGNGDTVKYPTLLHLTLFLRYPFHRDSFLPFSIKTVLKL